MNIQKVAVIGAGVMGSGIAAHIANAGIAVDLLDIVAKDNSHRSAIAANAISQMLKAQPAPFMHAKNARLITPGNIEDDLEKLAHVDWVIEAVIENPTIKQALYQKLEKICRPGTLISSNTSTIPLSVLTENLSNDFKQRFIITHFFNPPRYMRLLELVAPPSFPHDLLKTIIDFAELKLGKGCVICKDTPGFIANRIGTFWMQTAVLEAIAHNLTVEQCDAAMSLFGIPKTGVFALLDLVGLDLMPHILDNFKHSLPPNDPLYKLSKLPSLVENMINDGYTGRKGKGGFYRLKSGEKSKIKESIDLQTGSYALSKAFKIENISQKAIDLHLFLNADETLNQYAWKVWSDTLSYSAELITEISNDIVSIDTAMRLGYNWRYGPFELLDHLGVEWFCHKLEQQHQRPPKFLSNRKALYLRSEDSLQFLANTGHYYPIPRADKVLLLSDIKLRAPAIIENASASLWDIDDGIACLEFHSKMNTLDPDTLGLIKQSIARVSSEYKALVIYNEGEHFSAGANLKLLMPAIIGKDCDTMKSAIQLGQNTFLALKYAPFPVVGAPAGLALGGGCEILLHCDAIQAHAELYMGLVEVGVGLIPGWGGCKELLRRCMAFKKRPGGPMPAIAQAFETIGLAKVSKSAQDARALLFMAKDDGISMNKDHLLANAKARALSMVDDYQAPEQSTFYLPGKTAATALNIAIHNMQLSGKATDYDAEISYQLAKVLSGGDTDITHPLTEQELLDLELKSFLYLIQQQGSLARLEHMLKTGKPLHN
ncbi:MAG: 3-hydroxyacyl-CoA dehydrogenase [Methylococcaceae bacterium]|nr:3-hydroxyacyl-CoA dehydrogenase [Methylococcaceae bacterium]